MNSEFTNSYNLLCHTKITLSYENQMNLKNEIHVQIFKNASHAIIYRFRANNYSRSIMQRKYFEIFVLFKKLWYYFSTEIKVNLIKISCHVHKLQGGYKRV